MDKLTTQNEYSKNRRYQMRMIHILKQKSLLDSFIKVSVAMFFVTCFIVTTVHSEDVANSCVQCHSKSSFRITDVKLYKYYREWELSEHSKAGVTCVDCHGGNPNRTDKTNAHGNDTHKLLTAVDYEQIPVTCGKCHEENAENYKKSKHYKMFTENGSSHLTPTCITCHGSIDTSIPKYDKIASLCASCHNSVTENHPKNPEIASYLIKKLSFINSYNRYLIRNGVMKKNPQYSTILEEEYSELSQIWHTLELDRIEEKSLQIRRMLRNTRKELIQANLKISR